MSDAETLIRETLSAESRSQRSDPEPPEIVNSSFSTTTPTLQLAWDSTSLGALKTCPEYYNLSIRQGWTGHAESAHLTFGILAHSAKEMYDRLRIGGLDRNYYRNLRRLGVGCTVARKAVESSLDHKEALLCVLRFVLCSTWDFKRKRPWISDEPTKNRETLFRALVWYLDQFQNDVLQTFVRRDGKPAVELSFRFDSGLKSESGESFIFCGHLDRVAVYQDRLWITDIKTTKSPINEQYFDRYSPDNQVSMYMLAGTLIFHEPIKGMFIDAWQTLVSGARFQRGQINRTPAQLEEFLHDTAWWLSQAEQFAKANYWPRNDKSCDKFGGCQFRSVCSADPSLRPHLLKTQFKKRTWDPLKTREA